MQFRNFLAEHKVLAVILAIFCLIVMFFGISHLVYISNKDDALKHIPESGVIDMKVSYDTELVSNNSVGNEWSFECKVNGKDLDKGEDCTMPINIKQPIKISSKVTEYDASYSDIGTKSDSHSSNDLPNFDITHRVTVTEKNGRYTGNQAVWKIRYHFERQLPYWDIVLGNY